MVKWAAGAAGPQPISQPWRLSTGTQSTCEKYLSLRKTAAKPSMTPWKASQKYFPLTLLSGVADCTSILIFVLLLNREGLRISICVGFCVQPLAAIKCLKCLLIPWQYKYLDSLLYDYTFACLLWYRLMRILKKIHNAKKQGKTKEVYGVLYISMHICFCVSCSTLCHLAYSQHISQLCFGNNYPTDSHFLLFRPQ